MSSPSSGIARPSRRITPSITTHTQYQTQPEQHHEAEPLTQESLEKYWNELLDSLKSDIALTELLRGRKVVLKDQNNFNLVVSNLYLENEIRPKQSDMLKKLCALTGHELLQMKVVMEVEKRETVAYLPREKYEAMLRLNPALAKFKKHFPEIDF